MINCNTQTVWGFTALSWYLCFYTGEKGSSMITAGSFTHREVVSPLPNALQAAELLLHMWPRGSLDLAACFWGSALDSHARAPPGAELWNFRLCASLFLKTVLKKAVLQKSSIEIFSFSPINCFWGIVFFMQSFAGAFTLFFSTVPLSLSLYLLIPWSRILPNCNTHCFFLPQINSLQLLPSTSHFFSLYTCSYVLWNFWSIAWVFSIL